jgi:hypothetical protein
MMKSRTAWTVDRAGLGRARKVGAGGSGGQKEAEHQWTESAKTARKRRDKWLRDAAIHRQGIRFPGEQDSRHALGMDGLSLPKRFVPATLEGKGNFHPISLS